MVSVYNKIFISTGKQTFSCREGLLTGTLIILFSFVITSCDEPSITYPERKDIIETVYASGKIVPVDEHWLSAQSKGLIVEKLVEAGDTINAGQILYVISSDVEEKRLEAAASNYEMATLNLSESSPLLKHLRLSLNSAQIRFQNDSATYFRWKNLWEQNIGTRNNLDETYRRYMLSQNEKHIAEEALRSRINELRVTHNTADAQLAQARKEVADVCVKSDQHGVAYEVLKERGETVNMNEQLVLLGDAHRRYVKLYVDQQDISRVRIGQKVLLQIDANSGEIHEAAVSFISPVMNEADQTFMIEAEFVKPGRHNFVHSSVEANIIVDEKKNALVVPRSTLQGLDSIWTNKDGKGKKVAVKTGIENLDYVEIVSGIEAGTPLIINMEAAR